ncbi:50S ribosomal protein L6 [Maledivibacter halophilus]|uniref:Large ribosomal subunit protein uL6 n=1 Tax=Maledivibacter halophilus TaxID=36842 RepID=A0A1T5I818_9FIRM|nr:50S ribosomal protein L6 [Maledivibacter halophilus]SKC35297.1 large subunit ribosomal protein L6 [Maledivibacter halophilus]
MSRIGKQPITISDGVQVTVTDKNLVTVKGPKGELSEQINPDMKVNINDNIITVERPSDNKKHKSLHGLSRTLISNMLEGVTKGYEKNLKIIGVGYRAQKKGKVLNLQLGFSHPIDLEDPEGITTETPSQTEIIIKGTNKQAVGNYAAKIRELRPPEPYKGKGVRYADEYVRRKEGKAGK